MREVPESAREDGHDLFALLLLVMVAVIVGLAVLVAVVGR